MDEKINLSFVGGDADEGRIDLYDLSISNYGLARSVSLLGHYYQTGKILAHAPKSGVAVYAYPYEEGSFKNTVAAAVTASVISTPFGIFLGKTWETWFPTPNLEMQQVIELLKEQNQLMREKKGLPADPTPEEEDEVGEAEEFIKENDTDLQVLRSITANSFKDIFRPIGRTVDAVNITVGDTQTPVSAIDYEAAMLIQSEKRDDKFHTIVGVVNSFSRPSKTGIVFSHDVGRGFRIKDINTGRLPPQDDYSWSQYTREPIAMDGYFVRWFDGRVKMFLVEETRKIIAVD